MKPHSIVEGPLGIKIPTSSEADHLSALRFAPIPPHIP